LFRSNLASRNIQASITDSYPEISISINQTIFKVCTKSIVVKIFTPSEEIRYGPACWLWDYLRRSKGRGFFLPSSGGIDSCATALIVYSMCELVIKSLNEGGKIF
jgi:NAD+ synthase (glutamine-hydrolysing)